MFIIHICKIYLYSSSASELVVTIDVSYSKPADFSMDPPNDHAGSSITLTCRVEGVTDGLTYSWSSTCTHNCFVRGMTTPNVTRHGLHSLDSGTHTCNVANTMGQKGTAAIVMNVTGKALFMHVHLLPPPQFRSLPAKYFRTLYHTLTI